MTLIRAFTGLRPVSGRENDVVAPPYDVMNEAEARELITGRPWSFLHISRPEVDLPEGTDPYAPEVYAKGRENIDHMIGEGVLTREAVPSYYVYRLTMGNHMQTGLMAVASTKAYDQGRIKKHEFTRPVKEDDRVRNIDMLNAQTGPVFLVYPSVQSIDRILQQAATGMPNMDVTTGDEVRHELWVVSDSYRVQALTDGFETLDALYVADGHHRSAAASRVAGERESANPAHTGDENYNYFLSVIFPHDQMQILDYNRLVRDLNSLSKDGFLSQIAEAFVLEKSDQPVKPAATGEYGMYLDGSWYRLKLKPSNIPQDDPVARLDVSLLQDNLIRPLLGISDPRRENRIDFVGGIRGLSELEKRVDSGDWAVAFSLYPTTMQSLMTVADAGEMMPPKSTWFEPKLADGLVSHML